MNNFSNARAFFEKITDAPKPFEFLCNLINASPPTSETDWLEFKRGNKIDDDFIKRTWSKSLSAFANTSGGVLIFGIDCSKNTKNTKTDLDEAHTKELCDNAFKMADRLMELHHQATSPPVLKVEVKAYTENNQKGEPGFVVAYIPESNDRPHRGEYGEFKSDHRYWIRAGGSSKECGVSLLRLLFDPRPQPRLEPFILFSSENGARLFKFYIENKGYASAYDIYCIMKFDYKGAPKSVEDTKLHSSPGLHNVEVSKPLHPHLSLLFFDLPIPAHNLTEITKFECDIFCKDGEPWKYFFEIENRGIHFGESKISYKIKTSLRC